MIEKNWIKEVRSHTHKLVTHKLVTAGQKHSFLIEYYFKFYLVLNLVFDFILSKISYSRKS